MRSSLFRAVSSLAALTALAVPATADPPRVVADIPVTASLVAAVLGDLGAPQILVAAGQDAHDLQLKPSQATGLQNADLLVWIGPQMTGWLESAARGLDPTHVLTLLEVPGTVLREFAPASGPVQHRHDPHDEAQDGHPAHDGIDPHAWLDPANGQIWLNTIARELSARDPANAAAYAANAQAAAARLADLDGRIAAQLQPVAGKGFVVSHGAYGYFTDHYGLTPALAVAGVSGGAPGAAHLSDLRAQLSAGAAACAFPEANHDARGLRMAIEDTDVRLGDPLDK
ncbi:MAG TPA: zinc ABC transporter substrate-binding protein, partial [Paracoccus sp. (in: a-proteobacteria)]|nr:zinc ABC transporter substrate-binding protein [Paracoccus sp. (in: a-proteobacteria)]